MMAAKLSVASAAPRWSRGLRRAITHGTALRYARHQEQDHQHQGEIEEKNQSPGPGLHEPATDYGANCGKYGDPRGPGTDGATTFLFGKGRGENGKPLRDQQRSAYSLDSARGDELAERIRSGTCRRRREQRARRPR